MLLTACTGTPELQTQIREVRQEVPAELLACVDAVGLPPGDLTQRAVAQLLSDTYFAWQDCKAKLGEVRKLVDPQPPT